MPDAPPVMTAVRPRSCSIRRIVRHARQQPGGSEVDASLWTPVIAQQSDNLTLWRVGWPLLRQVASNRGWLPEADLDAVEGALDSPDLLMSSVPAVLCCGRAAPIDAADRRHTAPASS